jgi:hypothetical protein
VAYAYCSTVLPPSGAEFAEWCSFVRGVTHLAIAKNTLLSIYTLENGKLLVWREHALQGSIEGLVVIRYPGESTDCLVLSFKEAKVSVFSSSFCFSALAVC